MSDTIEHDSLSPLLTEEERQAMEAEEGAEIDGSASLTDDAAQEWREQAGWAAPAEPAPQGDDTAPAGDGEDTAAGGQGDDTTAGGDGQQQAAPAAPPDPGPAPEIDVEALDKRDGEIPDERKAIWEQYDDGELSAQERDEKIAALDAEMVENAKKRGQIEHYQTQVQAREHAEMQAWKASVEGYLSANPELAESRERLVQYDAFVRAVTGDQTGLYAGMTHAQMLEEAHAQFAAAAQRRGIQVKGPAGAALPKQQQGGETPADQEARRQQARAQELHTPPKTLRDVPASDVTGDDSRYARLTRIIENGTPEDAEHALAQMTPDERDRYCSSPD